MSNAPGKIVAGDTLEWRESLPDYPAGDGWTLHVVIYSADASYPITATADGDDHLVQVAAADTAAWTPGRYELTGYVTHPDGRKKTLWSVGVVIEPDPAGITAGLDGRSVARRMLDAIEAVLEKRASANQLDMVRYQFGMRGSEYGMRGGEFNTEVLLAARDRFRREVFAEEQAERLARGEGSRGWRVRF